MGVWRVACDVVLTLKFVHMTVCLSAVSLPSATPQAGVAEAGGRQHVSWRCGAQCSTEVNLRLAADDRSTVRAAFLVPRSAELACRAMWRFQRSNLAMAGQCCVLDGKVRMASSHTHCHLSLARCMCSTRANLHSSTAPSLVFLSSTSAGLNCDIPRLTSPASPYLQHS